MCLGKFCSNLNNARVPLRIILSPQVFPIDLLACASPNMAKVQ